MSIATGRDAQAYNLLQNLPLSVGIAIPGICLMEALSSLEDEVKRRNQFENELKLQISQLRRDLTSHYSQSLLSHLRQALVENRGLFNDIQTRLLQAFAQIYKSAEILSLSNTTLQNSLDCLLISEEPTDNLILHCILEDACLHAATDKVFLSSNTKDFNSLEVRNVLNDAGISKYFTRTQDFLSWLQASN